VLAKNDPQLRNNGHCDLSSPADHLPQRHNLGERAPGARLSSLTRLSARTAVTLGHTLYKLSQTTSRALPVPASPSFAALTRHTTHYLVALKGTHCGIQLPPTGWVHETVGPQASSSLSIKGGLSTAHRPCRV
jgi:hypothetical protein